MERDYTLHVTLMQALHVTDEHRTDRSPHAGHDRLPPKAIHIGGAILFAVLGVLFIARGVSRRQRSAQRCRLVRSTP